MPNIVNLSDFKPESFGVCLRRIYREIDRTFFPPHVHMSAYKDFFGSTRGRFLSICRKKKNISLEEAGNYLGVPFLFLELIENGQAPIAHTEFLKLCRYYGTQKEAVILTGKIESALKPKPAPKTDASESVIVPLYVKI